MAATADDVWECMRTLYEGGAVTAERLAILTRRTAGRIEARAVAENWHRPAGREDDDLRKRIDLQYARLVAEIERLTLTGEGAELTLDKSRIDAVMALVRALEKIGETVRPQEDVREDQIRTDAEIAALLARIDERIVELATFHARRLGAGEPDGT